MRPTVIFGEGNRGNVFNLLNQIASGRFLMVGKGKNKKSMAYIGNIVAFLETCIASNEKYGLYNYVDTPDFTMNDLVALVRANLMQKTGVGPRIPYWLGLALGYVSDIITNITGKKLPISSIRVKKFAASTELKGKANFEKFIPPYQLHEGLERTITVSYKSRSKPRNFLYGIIQKHKVNKGYCLYGKFYAMSIYMVS